MKTRIAIIGVATSLILAAGMAHATLYDYNFNGATTINAAIPDGNPVGYVNTISVSGTGNNDIRAVNVFLNISGGYNGDLYGYLLGPNGQLAVLLNRIGPGAFGNSGNGMTVTLDDAAGSSIEAVGATGFVSGTYQPSGSLAALNGVGNYANGTWTLFLADLSNGDQSTLVSWGLQIDVVPEPVTWALITFSSLLGVGALARRLRQQVA
ncbi:MAG: proprotein convertase P-domain-containing protein [Verrucomicrobia bacterium]|nr:proprotein convertase P-domain-containing protein [Verrucomicrobiota bacterium]